MEEVKKLNQTVNNMSSEARRAHYEISNIVTDEIHKTLNDPSHNTNPIRVNTKIGSILAQHFPKKESGKKRIKE